MAIHLLCAVCLFNSITTLLQLESYRLVSRQRDILIMPGYCTAGTLRNGGSTNGVNCTEEELAP